MKELRQLQVPVVFVTGHNEGAIFDRAKLVEPNGYVLKPYDDCTLKMAIELALVKHHADQERNRLLCRLNDMLT
jgi:FixJ family two-component response regulator